LGLAGCASNRRIYSHADLETTTKSAAVLAQISVEGWENLTFINPIKQPMGSPYLLLEFENNGQTWMTHAEAGGYVLFPMKAGKTQLTRLILLSPYASWIELLPNQPLVFELQAGVINDWGHLQLLLDPGSQSEAEKLPRSYTNQRSEAHLHFDLARLDTSPEILAWLAQRQTKWQDWPLLPDTDLKRLRQEKILAPFLE
jgi:hypothetical protein